MRPDRSGIARRAHWLGCCGGRASEARRERRARTGRFSRFPLHVRTSTFSSSLDARCPGSLVSGSARAVDLGFWIDRSLCCCRSQRFGLRCSPSDRACSAGRSTGRQGPESRGSRLRWSFEGILGSRAAPRRRPTPSGDQPCIRLPRRPHPGKAPLRWMSRSRSARGLLRGCVRGSARVAITPTGGSRRRGGRSTLC